MQVCAYTTLFAHGPPVIASWPPSDSLVAPLWLRNAELLHIILNWQADLKHDSTLTVTIVVSYLFALGCRTKLVTRDAKFL